VLVVDDDRDAGETLCELLELWGHPVWLARDGASGIDAARAHRPDVALLDIGMPGLDGYEVARRLRCEPDTRQIMLVALTGYGAEEDRRRAREAGFDHHLVKPADPQVLRRLLAAPAD
jgi:CheY-like chemotaxis protein